MRIEKRAIPIVLILIIATVLRFFNVPEQAFTHDEFSTIFRLDYSSLSDLINIGMKQLDNHPIGTQVFYYYYAQLFGTGEVAMKFPTILMGIFSVFMIYLLGKTWFNRSAGLFSASFFAVLQYTVAQSQTARMYGFGIPFILLTAYFWHFFVKRKVKTGAIIGFILSAAACCYIHYFSLLSAAIIGITGLFFIRKENMKAYVISGLIIVFLFVPHINIFIFQLAKGGIEGWLGAFEFSYIFTYLALAFNFSYTIGFLVIAIPLYFFNKTITRQQVIYRWISIIWFVVPLMVGFTYSYFFSNVVHERTLYFSFPFLILTVASFIKPLNFKKELGMVVVVLFAGTFSLVLERNHYYLFENNRYKLVAESLVDWQKELPNEDFMQVKFTYDKVDDYYNQKYAFNDSKSIRADSVKGVKQFIQMLERSDKEYLYFGRAIIIDATYLQIALAYFPEIVRRKYTTAGEAYLLKKSHSPKTQPCTYRDFNSNSEKYFQGTKDEYIKGIDVLLDTLTFSSNNIIEISVDFAQLDSIGGAKIVSSIQKNEKTIDWRSADLDNFYRGDSTLNRAYYTVSLPDVNYEKNARIKLFIWNPNKANYILNNINFKVKAGNPYSYAGTRVIPFNKSKYCLD